MAIIIALHTSHKKVTIPHYNSMYDLLDSSTGYFRQLSYSLLFFRWLVACTELFSQKIFPEKELQEHLEAAVMAYRNEMNLSSLDEDKIAIKLDEIMKSDEFSERYSSVFTNFTTEALNLFADGALALDAEVITVDDNSPFGRTKVGKA